MTIEDAAAQREAQWLAKHGAHEWEKHDLVAEAKEEAVDGWEYCQKALEGWNGPLTPKKREALTLAMAYFESAYMVLEGL